MNFMKTSDRTKTIVLCGFYIAVSMILSYIETLIPFNFGIPGIKLGLANLTTVIILYSLGWKEALCVNLIRIILSGFMFGNLSMIMYSLAGAILSFICMILVKRTGKTSPMGVSLVGGVTHNIGQLIVAAFALRTLSILYYVPVLIIAGAITGALIGYITILVLPAVRIVFGDLYDQSDPE